MPTDRPTPANLPYPAGQTPSWVMDLLAAGASLDRAAANFREATRIVIADPMDELDAMVREAMGETPEPEDAEPEPDPTCFFAYHAARDDAAATRADERYDMENER